jgi:hypothetical protein
LTSDLVRVEVVYVEDENTIQLVMVRGPQSGQVFELPRSSISIGRDPGNQVGIQDAQVSRLHARITPQGGLMVLEDMGSTNGTTVNGLSISGPHTLAHGDEIGLGDNVTLIFYGRPTGDGGETVVAPRRAYVAPSPAAAAPQPSSAPAYEAVPESAYQPPAPEYGAPPEYYEDYEEETGYNWALIGGCLLIAIILVLLLGVLFYFFAPAGLVDPIADFLAGLGIGVP